MESRLSVRNLRISFRTSNGKVQAVRGINFEVAKGETLAIVGESGSGKSVTSKAILGIQAANALTESGEIIYNGQDLLKISEEDFHKIRGDKVAMIFQDPMSSLNPIVKIGRQLTEAMILKGRARQRESRQHFNTYLKNLEQAMAASQPDRAAECKAMCKKFDKFEFKHIDLESAYNTAHEAALQAIDLIDASLFDLEKTGTTSPDAIGDIVVRTRETGNDYVVTDELPHIKALASQLKGQLRAIKRNPAEKQTLMNSLTQIRTVLDAAVKKAAPNFFRMGYYLTFANQPLPEMETEKLNAYLLETLNRDFMNDFIAASKKAIIHTADSAYRQIEKTLSQLEKTKAVYGAETLDKKESYQTAKELSRMVLATIDPLSIEKDSIIYTFPTSLHDTLDTYFASEVNNVKALRVYEKNKRKYDALVAKGKTPDWSVAQAAVTDLNLVKENIALLLDRLAEHYHQLLALRENRDYDGETIKAIDYLMTSASGVVAKVTRGVAKRRAIRLMQEVGIQNPHKRYNQYPFEFSGGMRQRIVIAIALAADPEILICDEPTTALDVTIQSQILELINDLKTKRQLSVIFITHDLGVVANMADRVAVMYAGKIVEYGTAEEVFYNAAHPYTWALLSSMPDLDTNEKLEAIPGTPPNMIYPPVGDAFAPRNKYAMQIDFEQQPPMFRITDTHYAATWLLHPDAPKVDPPKIMLDRIARMKNKGGQVNA